MTLHAKAGWIGAAAFAAGLSLVGPQATGVALSDSGEDSTSTSTSAADSPSEARPVPASREASRSATATARTTSPTRSVRGPRSTEAGGTASTAAAESAPRAAATVSAPPRPSSSLDVDRAADIAAGGDAHDVKTAVSTAATGQVVAPRHGVALLPSAAVVFPGLITPNVPAWAAAGSPNPPSAAAQAASTQAPVLTALTTVVNQVLDNLANLLSTFPAGPLNDLISGALLLTRRALSLIEPVPSPGSAPVAISVWLPNAGTYGTNAPMNFVVNFDQPVVVTNANVALPIEVNYVLSNAKYVSGSGTGSLLFSLNVPGEELDPNGIDLGVVSNQTGTRVFDFGNRIVARNSSGVAADNTIPTVNTSRVAVDSMGPQIAGRSDLQVDGGNVTLTVTFDRAVLVTGTPTVPVVVDGVNAELGYVRGNRTDTLTFRLNNPSGATVNAAEFRPLVGDVIYLSPTAGIHDRLGNDIYTLEGDIGTPLIENGNHVVVIGHHFEKLQTLSKGDLNAILNGVVGLPSSPPAPPYTVGGEGAFWYQSTFGPPFWNGNAEAPYYSDGLNLANPLNWPFNNTYQYRTPVAANYAVDVYRVAFRSSIPEQGRYTTAYGIAAVPVNEDIYGQYTAIKGPVPVVEWQQPTVFDLTNSAPSQAFSCGAVPTCGTQAENVPPRINIAQFGGQGYAVFIADPFGLGNSVDRYAYQLVGSAAQWSTDMLISGQALLSAREMEQSKLFLGGWSAGGNEAAAFLQSLQSQGQTVSGTVIASSPMALNKTVTNGIFNPRFYTPENTGNAVWLNVAVGFSSLSEGGFSGQPTAGLDLMGRYYDAARRLYTMQYDRVEFGSNFPGKPETQGVKVYYTDVDGEEKTEFLPYDLTTLIVPEYSSSEAAFQTSAYAKLMTANETGNVLWTSPVMLNYGTQDEVMPVDFGRLVYDEQRRLGNTTIQFNVIDSANHRGTYLAAVANALPWFNSLSGVITESPI